MHPFCPKTWTPIDTAAQLHGANTHNTHQQHIHAWRVYSNMAEGGGALAAPAMPEDAGALAAAAMAEGGGALAAPSLDLLATGSEGTHACLSIFIHLLLWLFRFNSIIAA